MRIRSAILLGVGVVCFSAPAWSQEPMQPSAFGGPAPGLPPGQSFPPPPPPPGQFMPAPMFNAPPASPPAPEKAIDLKGRVGFGVGLWFAPAALAAQQSDLGGSAGALGGLGSLGAAFGSTLSIRWWASDRVFLTPSLRLGISHTEDPGTQSPYQQQVTGGSYTNGAFAPALSLGYAAYRGKSTRFLLSAGLSVGYTVQEVVTSTLDAKNVVTGRYEADKRLGFTIPVGLALEQFFTPRISIVVGAESPLFSLAYEQVGSGPTGKSIGLDFSSTRLTGAFVFYTD